MRRVCAFALLQAAKTYLEKQYETFPEASLDELIRHGLKALAGSLSDGKLTAANTAVSVVGKVREEGQCVCVCVCVMGRALH